MAESQKSQTTLSVKEIREWMENAKQNNVEGMRSQYSAQPLLLDAAQSGIGNTAMHWAAAKSSEQALQFLLDQKASTTVRNSSECTPLHSAVRCIHGFTSRTDVISMDDTWLLQCIQEMH